MERKNNTDIVSKDEYFLLESPADQPWVFRVAREHWGAAFYQKRLWTDRAFVAFVQKGTFRIGFPDQPSQDVGPGSILYLCPGREHSIETVEDTGAHLLLMLLNNKTGIQLAQRYLGRVPCGLLLADPGRVEALFYRLLEVGEKGGFNSTAIASALVLPVLLTIDQEHRSHVDAGDPVFALFTRCRVFIENNWRTIASVNDVPSRFGISQPYMGRLFREFEDCTPHQFLLKQKMSYALYRLHQEELTIADLALELGFADAYSFSKTFKRIMGKSPSAMR